MAEYLPEDLPDYESDSDSDESLPNLEVDLELSDSDSSISMDSGRHSELSWSEDASDEGSDEESVDEALPPYPYNYDPLHPDRTDCPQLEEVIRCRSGWLDPVNPGCNLCKFGLHLYDTRGVDGVLNEVGHFSPSAFGISNVYEGVYSELHSMIGPNPRFRRNLYYYQAENWAWEIEYDCGGEIPSLLVIREGYTLDLPASFSLGRV